MSKTTGIKKRSFFSFFIYHSIIILIMCGGAAGSAVHKERTSDFSYSPHEHARAGQIQHEILNITPKSEIQMLAAEVQSDNKEEEYTSDYQIENEPRMLLTADNSEGNRIIGIDFTMLEHGKSRLIVTTSSKLAYNLDRVDTNTLALNIDDTVIPELLLREINTSQFQSAVSSVKPVFNKDNKKVSIGITLSELVPWYIKQTDNRLTMDFDRTEIKRRETKIVPINLDDAEIKSLSDKKTGTATGRTTNRASAKKKKYSGNRTSYTFIDTDVTHILQILNKVSKENLIWDDEIKGQKVSMIVENVTWEEVLDLIMMQKDLARRYVGENTILIKTKNKMAAMLAQEESEDRKLKQQLEEEERRFEEQKKKEEDEAPLITEYIPINFADASEIQEHIIKTPQRGTISIDTRKNTIIMTDTEERIEAAKKTIKEFDTPVKQILIEARIVDATDSFSRDLGIKWNESTSAWKYNPNTEYTVPADANEFEIKGQRIAGGTFSTNTPEGWNGNMTMNFAKAAHNGLSVVTLDATLAIAESEGTAKVISKPRLTAMEGKSSTISAGDSIIIPATENVASSTLDATLSLTVKPTSISPNNYITLEVSVTDDQAPTTSRLLKKSINTSLMIKSGDTHVIGGIIKESEGDDISGVPVLKDIPGVGWLFKAKRRTSSKSELLIFISATVIPAPVQ